MPDHATATFAGTVEKIIHTPGMPDKAQISIEEAEDLYREIRIEMSYTPTRAKLWRSNPVRRLTLLLRLPQKLSIQNRNPAVTRSPWKLHNLLYLPFDFCARPLIMGAAAQSNRRIRVLLADDQPVIRKMVRSTLQRHEHFEVIGEAEDGAQAVEQAKKAKPDVVILNITMPNLNGFQAAQEIKNHVPESAIVILSTHADKHFVEEAKKHGVRAYVSKSKIGDALIEAIEAAVKGEDFTVL